MLLGIAISNQEAKQVPFEALTSALLHRTQTMLQE
jgi:hypothetical protein